MLKVSLLSLNKIEVLKSRGFTLIEILAVVAILGLLSVIAVLSVSNIIEKSKRDVCNVNVQQLERDYEGYLVIEGIGHSDAVFLQYLEDYGERICPSNREITYSEGKVKCSLHPRASKEVDQNGDDTGEGVPFL
jgi:prepilin-type N-terminal cleavage/methylation domain-containing protein